jgi:CPA2 family monovalent cation:H+ antiporter-2
MTELALIKDLAIVWTIALFASYICTKIKQPTIAGYIISGILIGPYGLKLINQPDQMSALAEFGVALLLFALGVEVSIKQIIGSNNKFLVAGLVQIAATALIVWGFTSASAFATTPSAGILFGFICALSSTAVITKLLLDRAETDSIHGRILISILVIQDLSLVPLISLIPVLQSPSGDMTSIVLMALLKSVFLITIIFVAATKIIPGLLHWVTRSASREIFLLTVISLCLGIALLSKELGLSLALGAFLAGVMISESKYGHQALADLLPLSDLFATVFFVSVGMFLDPTFIAKHWLEVSVFVFLLIIGKTIVGALAALCATTNLWSATLVGIGLAQIGEFSFVLANIAHQQNILDDALFNLFFAGAVVTLIATPILMTFVPLVLKNAFFHGLSSAAKKSKIETTKLTDHIILCGFGRIGHNIGRVLKKRDIPFVVIEADGKLLAELSEVNIPYVFGNAFSRHVLLKAGLKEASCLVVTVPDPIAAVTIISFARQYNPNIKIIARAHRTEDIEVYRATGANAVVQPEFEASIELAKLVLLNLNLNKNVIQEALHEIQSRRYALFETYAPENLPANFEAFGHHSDIGKWLKINPGLHNKTIGELDVRKRTGAIILAIKRNSVVTPYPPPDTQIGEDDQVYIVGSIEELKSFENIFAFNMSK